MTRRRDFIKLPAALGVNAAVGSLLAAGSPARAAPAELLNVSYDPTRELYAAINPLFVKHWKARSGQDLAIRQSHGGSGKQARSVIDGLAADVVTLALAHDIDALAANGGWVASNWRGRLPHGSVPFASTVVLVVRKGNPKAVRGWDDLVRTGISVITPNPKTSGGARWNYLAAWEHAKRKTGGDPGAKAFVAALYGNVPVLDTGARGASVSFSQRAQGDVLIAWENEARLLQKDMPGAFEVVVPARSILAEPPVAVVDRNVDRKGTRAAAEAYLKFLYTDEAQSIGAAHFYRPNAAGQAREANGFQALELFKIDQAFGGWDKAHAAHFADGASFDAIYTRK